MIPIKLGIKPVFTDCNINGKDIPVSLNVYVETDTNDDELNKDNIINTIENTEKNHKSIESFVHRVACELEQEYHTVAFVEVEDYDDELNYNIQATEDGKINVHKEKYIFPPEDYDIELTISINPKNGTEQIDKEELEGLLTDFSTNITKDLKKDISLLYGIIKSHMSSKDIVCEIILRHDDKETIWCGEL